MKANEIMIGNWVNLSRGNWSENRQVELIDIEMIAESIYFAEPIPLTPEILEKNGFVYSDLPFEQNWQQFGLSIYGTTGNYHINCGMNVSMDVSNIHQLQLALWLCGIEKEIEL